MEIETVVSQEMITTSELADDLEEEMDPTYSHLEGWGENVEDTKRVIASLRLHPPEAIVAYFCRDSSGHLCFGVKKAGS